LPDSDIGSLFGDARGLVKQALVYRARPQKQKIPDQQKKKRVLVIAGPTAAGKTQLSLSLAQAIGGEILSADSCQVYRGMDIGTAKASPEERALIAHHLIDICDFSTHYNVAEFYKEAQSSFQEITARDNVPIVVGGSGFYIHALLYGPPHGPSSIPEVREQLERQMRDLGAEVLYERLQMLDPEYASTISEHDRHKIIRALEIMALSERRVSDFPKPAKLQEQDYDFRCWFRRGEGFREKWFEGESVCRPGDWLSASLGVFRWRSNRRRFSDVCHEIQKSVQAFC
jgi:tRNA dimethylallyltransferase